jgi:transposase
MKSLAVWEPALLAYFTPASAWASRVKKTGLYRERDEVERATFRSVVREIPPEKIIWVDETGIEEHLIRPYGRKKRGERLFTDVPGNRVGRTTLIAGYGEGRLKAPMRFKGYTNTAVFNAWVGQVLAKELRKGDVVIMDSASFHKSTDTRNLIEQCGATLLFQPKYSPDLNKSEPQWANLKQHIRADQAHIPFSEKLDKHIVNMAR